MKTIITFLALLILTIACQAQSIYESKFGDLESRYNGAKQELDTAYIRQLNTLLEQALKFSDSTTVNLCRERLQKLGVVKDPGCWWTGTMNLHYWVFKSPGRGDTYRDRTYRMGIEDAELTVTKDMLAGEKGKVVVIDPNTIRVLIGRETLEVYKTGKFKLWSNPGASGKPEYEGTAKFAK